VILVKLPRLGLFLPWFGFGAAGIDFPTPSAFLAILELGAKIAPNIHTLNPTPTFTVTGFTDYQGKSSSLTLIG
jgi:hypothetical protein